MGQPTLFKLSKKEELFNFIRDRRYVPTHQVLQWGCDNFCNEAVRRAQELVQEGKLKRMSKDDKLLRFGKIREAVFEFVE